MINFNTSIFRILIALDKEALQQVIDTQLPVDFLNQFSPPGAHGIRISARRKGKVDFQAKKNTFKYQVPLELFVQKDTMLGNVDVLFEMLLAFETQFLFKDNWEIATRTQLTGYQWIKEPKLDFGLINIPLDKTVLNAIQSNKEILCKQVDDKIKEALDIRPLLSQFLSTLPNPIPTPANGQVWWKCDTVETSMSPIYEDDNFVYTKIGLQGETEFSYGKALNVGTTVIKSPDIVPDIEKESHIQSLLRLDFRAMEKTALALLQKQKFEYKSQKVNVSSIQINQAGQRLKINLGLEGAFDGEGVLIGKPVFDKDNQMVKVTDAEFDLNGHNFISKTMVVFLKKVIEEKLMANLQFSITKSIQATNQKIKYFPYKNGFFAKAKINEVDLPMVDVEADALVLQLSVKAYLQLGLENANLV